MLINKNYSRYHYLKESQIMCSGTIKLAKPRPKFDVIDAKFEFQFPKDLVTLKVKEGTK